MAVWRMRIACWMPKIKNTRSEYVILIAFPRQQWLHERATLLRYSTLPVDSVLKVDCSISSTRKRETSLHSTRQNSFLEFVQRLCQ